MAERTLTWSKNAVIHLHEILLFYKNRNKSNLYSIKLYKRFNIQLGKVLSNPELGIKTKLKHIRGLVVGNYVLYYEISEDKITVLKFGIAGKIRIN
jgi:hypothetical protein